MLSTLSALVFAAQPDAPALSVGAWWMWVAFLVLIGIFLALDLGVFHKTEKALSSREAIVWFFVWVSMAALFAVFLNFYFGRAQALEFVAGYLLEESLSVDNIFVIILVFRSFRVPSELQHRVLFWGIIGAVMLRAAMILAGTALIHRFGWLNAVFGAFLVFTGLKLFFSGDDDEGDPSDGYIVRTVKRLIPSVPEFHGRHFFIRRDAKWLATPMFIVLVTVEFSDVIFALDSIPAIFGVTTDPFIVFTSNIFAILGLRTLFFLVSGMIDAFRFLKVGLAFILTFVGVKMVAARWVHVPIGWSLLAIALVLVLAIIASWLIPEQKTSSESAGHDKSGD